MREYLDILTEATVIKLSGFGKKQDPESPANQFVKAFMAATHEHPMDRGARLYGYSSIGLRKSMENPNNGIYLSDIQALEAGAGHGAKALAALCGLADQFGVTLDLVAKGYGPKHLTNPQLIAWYKRYGFSVDWKGQEGSAGMTRKPHHAPHTEMESLDEDAELPSIVYHGTTLEEWDQNRSGTMYFTSSREDAENYAEEAFTSEWYRKHEDGGAADPSIKAIIAQFNLSDLLKLQDRGAELQPDWGWNPNHNKDLTWEDSFRAVGSFCIDPFKNDYKKLARVSEIATDTEIDAAPLSEADEPSVSPNYFMHVTKIENVPAIMKQGLVPNTKGGNYDDMRWVSLDGVYASRDAEHLSGYMASHDFQDYAIVVVEILPEDRLPDEDLIDNNLRIIFDSTCQKLHLDPEEVAYEQMDFGDPVWTDVYQRFAATLGEPVKDISEVQSIIEYWVDVDMLDGGDALMDWSDMKDRLVRNYPHMIHEKSKDQYSVRSTEAIGFGGSSKIIAVVEVRRDKAKVTYNKVPPEAKTIVQDMVRGLAPDFSAGPALSITELRNKMMALAIKAHPDRDEADIKSAITALSKDKLADMVKAYEAKNS
jgi:hypothetical protein